jgi:sulfatase maturation enzyme AslB (radical SAM superfamily)
MSDALNGRELPSHFCILPWVHAQLFNSGAVTPCCRSRGLVYGSLVSSDFEQIWNGPPVRELRLEMLGNHTPRSCLECRADEERTGTSERLRANERYGVGAIDRMSPDGSVGGVKPRFLEVRFSNLCNFKCRTCGPQSSSSWYSDAKALGMYVDPAGSVTPEVVTSKILETVETLLPGLEEILFVGGEPTLHEAHYRTLERLIELGRTDVRLSYNTNFSKLSYRHWSLLSLWQKFEKVHVTASFDAVGTHAAVIRSGTDWAQTERNFKLFRLFMPKASFNVLSTISVMNCFHLPEAVERWLGQGMISKSSVFRVNLLHEPRCYSINVLTDSERRKLRSKYENYLDQLAQRIDREFFVLIEERFHSILALLDQETGPGWVAERREFVRLAIKLDRIRGESLLSLIPEIEFKTLSEP